MQTLTLPAEGKRPARRVETRVLLKQEADWTAYSGLWNDAQTDAALVPKEGRRISLPGQEWIYTAGRLIQNVVSSASAFTPRVPPICERSTAAMVSPMP